MHTQEQLDSDLVDRFKRLGADSSDAHRLASFVLDNLVLDDLGETNELSYRQIFLNAEKGLSIKPGNIRSNRNNILKELAAAILAVVGATTTPSLTIFVILLILYGIRDITTVELAWDETIVLLAMWKHQSRPTSLSVDLLLQRVNKRLEQDSSSAKTLKELDTILKRLLEIRCIHRQDDHVWLREEIMASLALK